eukprot:NODE_8297_length_1506_cov_37.546048.p1 GENE.NODE_8297_length_1506_cov_37.546048~~NODE_8297_length_1506_cov_37.546048.p1  ORF type:complete len:406 (-),score=77.02 NODE_8297_length_1506_cov_37.546048:211-1428(-)
MACYPNDDSLGSTGHLLGDFYCDPEDVTRGTAIDCTTNLAPPWSETFGHHVDSPTSKWAAWGGFGGELEKEAFGLHDFSRDDSWSTSFSGKFGPPSMMESEEDSQDTLFTFHESDQAREVPVDPLFKLEATTLEAYLSAAELGNRFASMLAAERDVAIIKFNRAKMSIKAEAWRPMPYMFKARVYRKGDHHHAVALQRCSGDAASFRQLFNRAQQLLEAPPCPSTQPATLWQGFFDMPLPNEPPHGLPVLQPLLALATPDAHPLLWAEAAVGLASVAAQPSCVKALCIPEAFAVLQLLLRSGAYTCLSAAAVVLRSLATQPSAMAYFADVGFWQALLDASVAEGTQEDLKWQFARIAADVYTFASTAPMTSPAVTQSLLKVLEATLNCPNISASVRGTLAAAVQM